MTNLVAEIIKNTCKYLQSEGGYLKDESCTSYPPGTIKKWLCLNIMEHDWTFQECFTQGMERGFSPKQIQRALKAIVDKPAVVDEALVDLMFTAVIPMPKWRYRNAWYDYIDTCTMTGKDYKSATSIDWWIDEYFWDAKIHIRPNDKMKEILHNAFVEYIDKPPKKNPVTRYLELFNTYDTEAFREEGSEQGEDAVPAVPVSETANTEIDTHTGTPTTQPTESKENEKVWCATCFVCGQGVTDSNAHFCSNCGAEIIDNE